MTDLQKIIKHIQDSECKAKTYAIESVTDHAETLAGILKDARNTGIVDKLAIFIHVDQCLPKGSPMTVVSVGKGTIATGRSYTSLPPELEASHAAIRRGVVEVIAEAMFLILVDERAAQEEEREKKTEKTTPKGFDGLGPKIIDMRLQEFAGILTDKQMECYSLRKEYDLPVAEVARRLGITRPAVDKRLDTAGRKLESAGAFEIIRRKAERNRQHRD